MVGLATLAVWALPAGDFTVTTGRGAPNPLLYALQTALPAVSLGVVAATPWGRGVWAEIIAVALHIGRWLLIVAVIAGIGSIFRRGD